MLRLFACLLCIVGLLKSAWAQSNEWEKMFPLNQGDLWVYEERSSGGVLVATEYKKVISDTIINNRYYFTIERKQIFYDMYDEDSIFWRIDSLSSDVYSKSLYEEKERFFLKLDVAEGDTFPDPEDPWGGYWEVSDVFNENDQKNIIYNKIGLVAHGIWLVENLGIYEQYYEAGGYETLRGAYIDSQLFGDTTFVTSISMNSKSVPSGIALYQNSPNPFNSSTKIKFSVQKPQEVEVAVFDVIGREVFSFGKRHYNLGHHALIWRGTNQAGEEVSSGVYYYVLSNGIQRLSEKMLLIK